MSDTLNKERLEELASFIEGLPKAKFDMGIWREDIPPCGTVACIGGWGEILFSDILEACDNEYQKSITYVLGLSWTQQQNLFDPLADLGRCATPAQTAAVIRHLVKTGEVDWSIPLKKEST